MKCGLNNYWWEYPNYTVCEGSIISREEAKEMASRRNGFGYWEKCDGDIEIDIQAQDEPYFGGSSASLRVEFRCSVCGNSYYPDRNLPSGESDINQWLNTILKEMK